MNILVTGGAGFIGSHTCEHLLEIGHRVVAVDNFDRFYSPKIKRKNIENALKNSNYRLVEGDFGDRLAMGKLLKEDHFDVVLHLAAQAGVRPSIYDPLKYERVNVAYLVNLLEAMREHGPHKLVSASSSAVYGSVTPPPFREDAPCMEPLSPYGATKRAGEIFIGTYVKLYGFKAIVVRPFTVYGPRQRPDMAIASFARKILLNEPITLFGDGSSARDYTYVADIVMGLTAAVEKSPADFGIYNLGGERPISLNDLVAKLEHVLGRKAIIEREPIQGGDIERTCADISKARNDLGYVPRVGLDEGLEKTVAWVQASMDAEIAKT